MRIHYKFLCIADKAVLHYLLCLIIQHIVDTGSGEYGSCFNSRGVCYILSGRKSVSTVAVYRVGFDLMRVVVDQDLIEDVA